MIFDVPINDGHKESAIEYCLLRVRDLWPGAVMVCDGEQVCTRMGTCATVSIVPSRDAYLTDQLFSCKVPKLTIRFEEEKLHLKAENGAADIAQMLAALPFWSHRVSSGRLESISE